MACGKKGNHMMSKAINPPIKKQVIVVPTKKKKKKPAGH